MEPIRILHMIGSLDIGGSQTMLLNLYRSMDRDTVRFDLVLDHPEERALAAQFEALGARIYTMPAFRLWNVAEVRAAWNRFFAEHPEYRVLHSHIRSYASVYLPIAKKHGLKTIQHSHGISNGFGIRALLKGALQYPLRHQADHFFSCSEEAGKWLFGANVARGERHHILKNGICTEQYRFNERIRAEYRASLCLQGKRVYAHAGRFHPQKNHEFLLRVFRKIKELQDNAVLLLIGDGAGRPKIEAMLRRFGLEKSVMLLGDRQDVAALLQAADVFLFPSHREGLGIAAVEAQAAGLPCICSDGVPRLAKLTEDCAFLPLRESAWVHAALHTPTDRADTYEKIVASGFDAKTTAAWLEQFYLTLWHHKKYLFASAADLGSNSLTGAHRRLLELMRSIARRAEVAFVGRPAPQLQGQENITLYPITFGKSVGLPRHVAGGMALYRALKKRRKALDCDWAVSFSPVTSICYRLAGFRHIVTLLREDLIGYRKALQVPPAKLAYFQLQERLAVKVSEKIIVQCVSDRENLIARNEKYCPGLAKKVQLQINNANASWMRASAPAHADKGDIPKLLFIGNFSDRRKGHFLLLPAAARLLEEGYAFELTCVGGGKELPGWQQKYQGYTAIRFPGQVRSMAEYLLQSDILLVPSLIDSCPNAVLEGLNAGLAVYGSRTGGIPDLLQDPAWLFEPDEACIYTFLKEVLESGRWRRDAAAQQARKESLSFDWGQKMQERIES